MSDPTPSEENDLTLQGPPAVEGKDGSTACKMPAKDWLKGILPMAICCAAPLLLIAAIPILGLTFGSLAGIASGLLSVVAVLACPVAMYLMMRMMMKDKK
ncbi:MAG: hypothetical protein HY695_24875 [Deltaproteobacteria bacterium]|nr:hypothetical protein [Deltaproteobacteria bacterium]